MTWLHDGWHEGFWEMPRRSLLIILVLVSLAVISLLKDLPWLPSTLVYPAGLDPE